MHKIVNSVWLNLSVSDRGHWWCLRVYCFFTKSKTFFTENPVAVKACFTASKQQ